MAVEILMPALSPTMTEGTLSRWVKKEGDAVKSGDVIAEIETDKATMEVEAVDEGTLAKILIKEGSQGVAVNTPIALLLEEGEDASALAGLGGAKAAPSAEAAAPVVAPAPVAAPAPATASGGRVFASPLAKRIAGTAGLDIAAVHGTGPNGRVVKVDVEAALAAPKPVSAPLPAAAAPVPAPKPAPAQAPAKGIDAKAWADQLGLTYRAEPLSSMRKVIARRLSESKQTVPHFYVTVDCRIDALLKTRADLNAGLEEGGRLSVNDFVIRAAALALKKVPEANASFSDEAMLFYDHADVSVAVATPAGLITPIVKRAETKGLAEISAEMRDLAKRARDGKLKPEEFQGGTFSISNLGMFGVREFQAIINPPQGAILAVGAGEKRPVVDPDGSIVAATVMTLTLSVDHRVVDGAVGAKFLKVLKGMLEAPLTMML